MGNPRTSAAPIRALLSHIRFDEADLREQHGGLSVQRADSIRRTLRPEDQQRQRRRRQWLGFEDLGRVLEEVRLAVVRARITGPPELSVKVAAERPVVWNASVLCISSRPTVRSAASS